MVEGIVAPSSAALGLSHRNVLYAQPCVAHLCTSALAAWNEVEDQMQFEGKALRNADGDQDDSLNSGRSADEPMSRRKKGKDGLCKRMRYRKVLETLMAQIEVAPFDFLMDRSVLPESISKDEWLMGKLIKRLKKHQEDLQNNIMSI